MWTSKRFTSNFLLDSSKSEDAYYIESDFMSKLYFYYINKGYTNFCFLSDDIEIKKEYENIYKNKCNIISVTSNEERSMIAGITITDIHQYLSYLK